MSKNNLLNDLDECRNVPELHAAIKRYAADLGYEFFIYAVVLASDPIKPLQFVVSGFPRKWRTRYDEMGYINTDPVVRHCMSSLRPVLWATVPRSGPMAQSFFSDASRHGLVDGITSPIIGKLREIGAFSMATSKSVELDEAEQEALLRESHWAGMLICEAFERIVLVPHGSDADQCLTDRELDVLSLVAGGHHDKSIGGSLGISGNTVRFHIANAGNKLGGIVGRHQIVARALEVGQLRLDERGLSRPWAVPRRDDYQS